MKGFNLLFFLFLVVQLSELGINGQFMDLGNYVVNRMVKGAYNIMQLPSNYMKKPGHELVLPASSQHFPQYERAPENRVPQTQYRRGGPYRYEGGYGSQAEHSYERPQHQSPPSHHGGEGYVEQPPKELAWTNGWGNSETTAPHGTGERSSYHPKVMQKSGGYKDHSKGPYKRVCKLNQAPTIVINSAADIPPGSILRDAYGNVVQLQDVVINPIPQPPTVISVGIRSLIPANYSMTYIERIDVNLDPATGLGGPAAARVEAHYSGTIRRPHTDSILHTKNQRPRANNFQIETFTVQTPNNSAPIDGLLNINGFFQAGIDARRLNFPNRVIRSQLETQIRALGRIFNDLNGLEEPPVLPSSVNSFASGAQIDAPLLGVQIQRFTIPEPNSGERGIIDAYFNFGLPAHPFEFVDIPDLVRDQYIALRNQRPQVSPGQLGSSPQEISDTLTGWIRDYVRLFRKASAGAYARGEQIAYEGFRQDQFFIHPPGQCAEPIDPPSNSGTTNMQTATGGICMKNPPPPCFPPDVC